MEFKGSQTLRRVLPELLGIVALVASAYALAAIPASERSALLSIYTSTSGPGWTNRTGWNGPPGTECTWFGVSCDPGATHVQGVVLQNNNLIGSLPSLAGLPNLIHFWSTTTHCSRRQRTGSPALFHLLLDS